MKREDAAPFHLGSESGNICPISGSPKAPKIASTTQWSNTSPATTIIRKFNKHIRVHTHIHIHVFNYHRSELRILSREEYRYHRWWGDNQVPIGGDRIRGRLWKGEAWTEYHWWFAVQFRPRWWLWRPPLSVKILAPNGEKEKVWRGETKAWFWRCEKKPKDERGRAGLRWFCWELERYSIREWP